MNFKKGMKLHFVSSNRTETIEKGSSNPVMGMIKTDKQEYSCDFIHRWLYNGFVRLYDKKGIEIIIKQPDWP
jgi:hypothetical protein